MHHFIHFKDYSKEDIFDIFKIADDIKEGKYQNYLQGKTILLFFSTSSLRTRVSFEKGIALLGGQSIVFPPEALDKRENIKDIIQYLNNWVDAAVIRHKNTRLMEQASSYAAFPIINGLSDESHPCEILSDLYALSKIRTNFCADHYLFVGAKGNIGNTWKSASDILSFSFAQACPKKYEIEDTFIYHDLKHAIEGKDIICTDSLTHGELRDFKDFQISTDLMNMANTGALLNPCPPFYYGEEVTQEVIESPFFVGYGFKESLLEIQQAILIYNMFYLEFQTKRSLAQENDPK